MYKSLQEKLLKNEVLPSEFDLSPEEADLLAKELKVQLRKGLIPSVSSNQLKLMVAGLGDKRGLIRRVFSKSLGLVGKRALPELKAALLHNKSVIRRRAAAKTLKLVGEPSALPYLLEAVLNDKDPVVQGSSVGAMAIFGKDAVNYLLEVLLDPKSSEMQCGLAAWGLSFIGKDASESLKKAARSDQPKIKAAAISALGDQIQYSNDIEARNLVIDSIEDPSIEVQSEAIKLIGKLEDAKWAAPYLITKLNSFSSQIKKDTAISLMELNIVNSIDKLKASLSIEKDPKVVRIFELAIKRLSK